MPFETGVTPFAGDDDMGDFMLDVWLPFARDDAGWVDNRAPVVGTRPNVEVWTHRGTTGAPTAPFFFARATDDDLFLFTGTGVDDTEEIYDQPGNPANAPPTADFSTMGGNNHRCPVVNLAVGPYQAYWLFSDTSGRYVHCVLKVSGREYRHFHVGLLSALHSGLDDDAFYLTGHYWSELGVIDSPFNSHNPYRSDHRLPFQPSPIDNPNSGFNFKTQFCSRFYLPGLNPSLQGFHLPFVDDRATIGTQKMIGDVNTNYTYGICQCSGWGAGLGAILWASDRNFTANMVPLVPIYVSGAVDFEGLARQGVVAQVPDLFRVNMQNLAPEQEIVVGGDTYVVFPLMNKDNQNVLPGEGYSGYEGLAYRKETDPVV